MYAGPPAPHPRARPSRAAQYLAGGALILLISGAVIYAWDRKAAEIKPDIMVVLGMVPIDSVYTLDAALPGTEPSPLQLATQGNRFINDVVVDDGVRYFLLSEKESLSSQLYREEEDGTLVALTSSPDLKFDLAYDKSKKRFAYVAGAVLSEEEVLTETEWEVRVLELSTGIERSISRGVDPAFSGSWLYVRDESALWRVDVDSGSRARTMEAFSTYAVNPENGAVALYNPVTMAIDYFSVSADGTASYKSSNPQSSAVSAMAYIGKNLVVAGPANIGMTEFFVETVGAGDRVVFQSAYPLAKPHKIFALYEN